MPPPLDPQIAKAFAALAAARSAAQQPVPTDMASLRATTDAGLEVAFARLPDAPDVAMEACSARAHDGHEIAMRWYSKPGAANGSAVVYAHGGGMICGSIAVYDRLVRHYVNLTGAPFLAVDYRLAPEYPNGLGRDLMTALNWLASEAQRLGVDPNRIAVMGDSGGGGVAAAAAIQARDARFPLARQILVYPMLDDRNTTPDPHLTATAVWSYDFNRIAWDAVLGKDLGSESVSPHLSPARLSDFTGLAPAYIEVGELDIFRDECLRHAQGLSAAGVSCELHIHPGAPHGFDIMNLDFDVSRRALADRVRAVRSI